MRRFASLFLFLALALATMAACSKGGGPDGDVVTGPDDTSLGDDGTDGDGSGDSQNGGDKQNGGTGGGPQTTARNGGSTATTRGGGLSGNGTSTTRAGSSEAAAYAGARGGSGDYARTLLRPAPAGKLVVEILHQDGAAPTQASVSAVVNELRQASGKSVALNGPTLIPGADSNVSEAEIEGMADRYGKAKQGNGQAVVYLLFLKGAYNGDDSVLGIAVRGDTAAVMSDQVRSAATPLATRQEIEHAVSVHELGHLLGLVDIVLKTGRADKDHPGHSANDESVMYWAVESDLVSQALGGPPPTTFDSADRTDLLSLRNGA